MVTRPVITVAIRLTLIRFTPGKLNTLATNVQPRMKPVIALYRSTITIGAVWLTVSANLCRVTKSRQLGRVNGRTSRNRLVVRMPALARLNSNSIGPRPYSSNLVINVTSYVSYNLVRASCVVLMTLLVFRWTVINALIVVTMLT